MNERSATAATAPAAANGAPRKRWQGVRAWGMWTMVVGFGLIFAGQISASFALGGMAMVLVGLVVVTVASIALRRGREDPWKDRAIDAWERGEMDDDA